MYLLLLRIFLKTESSESGSFNRVTWNRELRKKKKKKRGFKNYARNSKVQSNLVTRIVIILYQRGLKFNEFVQRELVLDLSVP